ncbi:Uncharacterised protein [Zhongshania aliphaticivorans]|uniref:Uncharacterized protein n=1 Tax=Zhongshania aliphaticivorans TaxID=1470434 RepID=A0A5S9Q3E5_9GAMM|nr:hypothetical protein [Zhongshania aliphaticivorans]CAA0111426.1 Uncharacterised protein [Zhongshania aliphaticivorans]CAA0118624.1 Uncharacterised protein [Zhongshania aliphaticivorans]
MKLKSIKKLAMIGLISCSASAVNSAELPIIGVLNLGGEESGLLGGLGSALGEIPVVGGLLGGDLLNLGSEGLPLLGDLSILGSLPLVDGRGLPVVGGLDGALTIVTAAVPVVLGNPNLNGRSPVDGILLPVVDMLVNGGPTLDFLALDLILPL